jgi:type I restriction enzyme R subunit
MKFSEDRLIEQTAIKLFEGLHWKHVNAYTEAEALFGRKERNEVLLPNILQTQLQKLNPNIPQEGIDKAIEELSRSRASLDPIVANKEIYELLKNGFQVELKDQEEPERVFFIDFNEVENNDFTLVSQLWINGDMYTRRPDLLGFVNGIPLLFIELKAAHQNLKSAFDNNLRDYKDTIPQLFWYNAILILSNGLESKCGSISSQWEHFYDWKKINSEGEEGEVSMETIIKGIGEKKTFLGFGRELPYL